MENESEVTATTASREPTKGKSTDKTSSSNASSSLLYFQRKSHLLSITSLFFLAAFIWHSRLLPSLYNYLGPEYAAIFQFSPSYKKAFREQHLLDSPEVLREFGLFGAASHTVVFVFGLLCVTILKTIRFTSLVVSDKGEPEPIGIGVSIMLVIWTSALFHLLAHEILRYLFISRYAKVYEFANAFYVAVNNEELAQSPFAWASSMSYTAALIMGFILSDASRIDRIERIMMGPFHAPLTSVFGSVTSVVFPFAIWIGLLDSVILPVASAILEDKNNIVSYLWKLTRMRGIPPTPEEIVDGSHALAFAAGLVVIFITGPGSRKLRERCDCERPQRPSVSSDDGKMERKSSRLSDTDENDERMETIGILNAKNQQISSRRRRKTVVNEVTTYDLSESNLSDVLLTMALTALLLSSALFKEKGLLQVLYDLPWTRMIFNGTLFGALAFFAKDFFSRDGWEKRVPRQIYRVLAFGLAGFLWNSHFMGFGLSWALFHMWSSYLQSPNYTQTDAFYDGLLWVGVGPYLGPVIIHGIIKYLSQRFRLKWGLMQETLLASICLVPLGFTMWHKWHNDTIALPPFIIYLVAHLLYLLTWRGRPELTGWRNWPELKENRVWWLLQFWFQTRIIIDNKDDPSKVFDSDEAFADNHDMDYPLPISAYPRNFAREGFEPNVPRIFGFHPHGLMPCTVIWMHLIPLWKRVFGKLIPFALTDGFTHVAPGMREFTGWSGTREITKEVITEMLDKKKSVIIVPGGQGEIFLHTAENLEEKQVVLCAKHTGFVRVAISSGAQLVPIFSFGELIAIKNISLPPLQRFTRKTIGFPIPFWPVGFADILPVPKETQISLVFGTPIDCSVRAKDPKNPTEEEIRSVWKEYFDNLRDIFNKYKETCGFEDWTIFIRGIDDVAEKEGKSESKNS